MTTWILRDASLLETEHVAVAVLLRAASLLVEVSQRTSTQEASPSASQARRVGRLPTSPCAR